MAGRLEHRRLGEVKNHQKRMEKRSQEELGILDKTIQETEAGLHVFEKIKDDVLEETAKVLDQCEDDFHQVSQRLASEHESKIEEYTEDMDGLKRLLQEKLERLDEGQQELNQVARPMRPELVRYVKEATIKLAQEQVEHARVHQDITHAQELIDRVVEELRRRLDGLRPCDLESQGRGG